MGVSSVTKQGLPELWEKMEDFRSKLTLSGDLERRREKQHVLWMRNQIRDNILQLFNEHPAVKQLTPKLEFLVEKGALTPGYAADILLYQFSASMATADVKISQPVADEVLAAGKELVNELHGKDD
jgi:LAO/AO transport system kinase